METVNGFEKPDNKYRYWMVTLQSDSLGGSIKKEENWLPHDFVLEKVFRELCEEYVYQLELTPTTNKPHWQCCLKLKTRKRQNTLILELKLGLEYHSVSAIQVQRMMGTWEQAIAYCSKTESRVSDTQPFLSSGIVEPYRGSDISILDDPKNWFEWQATLFEILFEVPPNKLREPNGRDIIWITDEEGNTGKSKFVKYCCFHNKTCAKISFGSAGQLRSAIISSGSKQCYFVDLPRTLGTDDHINSIISAIEDILNGFVVSSYYGETKTLMMQPPHVVVFSNQQCPYDKLSSDRWKVYSLRNKELNFI